MNRSTYKAYLGWSVLRSPWPERREYLMVEDTVDDPRPITQGPRFDCDRDVTEQAVLLARSVGTMLPRLGSTRGDSRRLEGTTAWLEHDDRQRLIARSPLPSLIKKSRGSGSTPAARTTFLARRERQRGTCPRSGAPRDDTIPPTPAGPQPKRVPALGVIQHEFI